MEIKLTDAAEIDRFEQAVNSYFNLQIDADRFTAIRLQQGVYGQRQEGVNMLRVKVPGGKLNPQQLRAISEVIDTHSQQELANVTTRQALQIHFIPLAETPAAMRILAKADLTTREACGNTVRNVTACPLAGVCPKEHVDVGTHIRGATLHFLRNPLSQQMPRKLKMSFSGCEADCAQAMIHDIGLVATKKNGQNGFRLLAGGGLGHKPHQAIVVEEFILEQELIVALEALVAVHNRYSDRAKRARSRIKFLVDRFGPENFVEKYREELASSKDALANHPFPQGAWQTPAADARCSQGAPRGIFAQKQPGLFVVPISLQLGEISSKQLSGLARLLQQLQLAEIRTSQDQNLMILNVPKAKLEALRQGLIELGLREPIVGDDVVACPGTNTCRLGITSSTILAPKLSGGRTDLKIRVSGCHNGCAQPETGDIGMYGEGRRLHGKLVPHYQMFFGGDGRSGGALALKGPSVPAARIETAVARAERAYAEDAAENESYAEWARRQGAGYFESLLADLTQVAPHELGSVLRDHGDEVDFKVLQLGGGECAGAVQVKIGSTFFEAAHERHYRNAFVLQRKYTEAAKCAETIWLLIGQGLVELVAGKRIEHPELISAELDSLIPGPIADGFAGFSGRFAGDNIAPEGLPELFKALDSWTREAALFCEQHDRQLDLTEALPKAA